MARTTTHGQSYSVCRWAAHPWYSSHDRRCTARYSPAGQLDELVWHDLCDLLRHPEWIAYALERTHGGHWLPQELQARKEALRKGQRSVTNQLERLTAAYVQGVIPLVEYQRRRRSNSWRCKWIGTDSWRRWYTPSLPSVSGCRLA